MAVEKDNRPILSRRGLLGGIAAAIVCPAFTALATDRSFLHNALNAHQHSPDQRLASVVEALVRTLWTDRAFIYMRDQVARQVAYTHLHANDPNWRRFSLGRWSREPDPETLSEPMLKRAFSDPRAHFIDDIETAPPDVLNKHFERSFFGHRALIHAPLYQGATFYGILETATRHQPRIWSTDEKDLIRWLQPRTAELCQAYLAARS